MKTALYNLAHARSGDKGDVCNVGVIARKPEYWPVIEREVTADRVKEIQKELLGQLHARFGEKFWVYEAESATA